ncbi:MAG: GCN5-related N-acetyltransferase [uncultured bacterium]|nr:MAG: GCN5-related N-acetyltransferase [uncultured bacterium]
MLLRYKEYKPCDAEKLALWISREEWPFHGSANPSLEKVKTWIENGDFQGEDNKAFWVFCDGEPETVGMVCLHEMTDDTPIFDLRLKGSMRHKGLGRKVVRWLADYVFTHTDKDRIEGHTRVDNLCMRKVFRACGWVKESHHRRCWPDSSGKKFDATTYAILKEDWQNGITTPVNWDDE